MGVFIVSADLIDNKTPSNYDDLFNLISRLSDKNKVKYVTTNVMVFESSKETSAIRESIDSFLNNLKEEKEIKSYQFVLSAINELKFHSKEYEFLRKIKRDNNI